MEYEEAIGKIEGLIDAWCARRAINLLRILLPVYPLPGHLTDAWAELGKALKDIRFQNSKELSAGEYEVVVELVQYVDKLVYR